MQVWEHDGPAQLNFTGEDLSNAIEDGRLVDLSELMNSEKEGMTTTTKTKKKSSRKRPWLGAVIEDAPLVSLHIATNGIGLGCSTHDASNGGQGLNLGLGDLHCCQILSMDVGGTSLFLDRYRRGW